MSSLLFSRNTKVFIQTTDAAGAQTGLWEIPVLEGFSFSQGTNTSEISLNESVNASGRSKRSRQMFTDSYAPAEWSFSTYVRPVAGVPGQAGGWEGSSVVGNKGHALEEVLWANFVSNPVFTASSGTTPSSWDKGITNTATQMQVNFKDSEAAEMGTFTLYFVMSSQVGTADKVYKITECCVNEASMDFDIDGIASIAWSGFGSLITDEDTTYPTSDLIAEGVTSTDNFIRNRLTQLSLQAADGHLSGSSDGNADVYKTVLTGGSITFSNNMTFLTPETMAKVNTPLGHVTGTRSISGSFTSYLDTNAGSTFNTADLFSHIVESTSQVTNSFDLDFSIGGSSGTRVEVSLPKCHLEVPSHSIDDIISLEVAFHALPEGVSPDLTDADAFEAKLVYHM